MLDLAKLTGSDKVVGLIEENLAAAPEMGVLPSRTIRGTSYPTAIRKTYPSVGFRAVNEGTPPGKSEFERKTVQCFVLSSLINIDKALAQAHEDGEDDLKAIEAAGVMKQAMIEIGQQVYYGTKTALGAVGNAKGFPGLVETVSAGLTVDAGGTTANTASSVYACKLGPQDVTLVFGNGRVVDLSQWREETILDVPSFVADLTGWVGLQVVNPNSAGRIKKLTADAGKTLTDALLSDLWALFPVGNKPTHWFMSRRSQKQLQQQRVVTINAGPGTPGGGLSVIASPPDSAMGIPIVVTDSIVDVESLSL